MARMPNPVSSSMALATTRALDRSVFPPQTWMNSERV